MPSSNGNTITWKSPSNIAIVKYWGKRPVQIPENPSISFTLSDATTATSLEYQPKEKGAIVLDFLFEGQPNEAFRQRILKFLQGITNEFPFLDAYSLKIESSNTFPHSAGIASSASAMSALALCLVSMEEQVTGEAIGSDQFYQKASHIARLGSGSAARSVYGGVTLWGNHPNVAGSSDLCAIPLNQQVHQVFQTFHDHILIVSTDPKAVSSSAGHALMKGNPYAPARYQQANENIASLLDILSAGDLEAFIELMEYEALSLHALMQLSKPSVVLFQPNTWQIINRLRTFRKETGYMMGFTLDAGPNVHILFPDEIKSEAETFIKEELVVYCAGNWSIPDKVGQGPIKPAG